MGRPFFCLNRPLSRQQNRIRLLSAIDTFAEFTLHISYFTTFDNPSSLSYKFAKHFYRHSNPIPTKPFFKQKGKRMKFKNWPFLVLLLVIFVALLAPSCGKKEIRSEPVMSEEARRQAEEEARRKEMEKQAGIREQSLKEEGLSEQKEKARFERDLFENEDILFEFDSAKLSDEAQKILRSKADWLRKNPRAQIIIEGHCDERGTNEYNLALGDRRALSAKAFLVDLGIDPSRISTVSYGEERPLDPRSTEEAWAKNRRDHFVIKQ
jgi:peptidoglycan-associated lipoprotein